MATPRKATPVKATARRRTPPPAPPAPPVTTNRRDWAIPVVAALVMALVLTFGYLLFKAITGGKSTTVQTAAVHCDKFNKDTGKAQKVVDNNCVEDTPAAPAAPVAPVAPPAAPAPVAPATPTAAAAPATPAAASGPCDVKSLGGNWVPAGANMWKYAGPAATISVPASGPTWVIDHALGSITNGMSVTTGAATAYCLGGGSAASASTSPAATAAATPASGQCPSTPEQAASLLGGDASKWSPLPDSGWHYSGPSITVKHPGFGRVDYDGGQLTTAGTTPPGILFTLWCKP